MLETSIQDSFNIVAKLTSNKSGKMKSYVAILLVSIGKNNFEDEKIKAAINMINQEFKRCFIIVADTLQRYNIATDKGISEKDAYNESFLKGTEWLEKYLTFFSEKFTIPYEIIRWDALINDDSFEIKEKKFSLLFNESILLQNSMNNSIQEYGERLFKNSNNDRFEQLKERNDINCFYYLKEECIAIALIPKKTTIEGSEPSPMVIVYPGKSTEILTKNRELFIKEEHNILFENYDDFLNWIPYRFNKVKKNNHDNFIKENNTLELVKEKPNLDRINHIKKISEIQLGSIVDLLDQKSLSDFNSCLLNYLLNEEFNPLLSQLNDNIDQFFSLNFLAYFFYNQLISVFDTLDKKSSNQCKANIVRILKRGVLPIVTKKKWD